MIDWVGSLTRIAVAMALVLLNGFFVAAEFALVKVRRGRLESMADEGRPFAGTAKWLAERLDASLSACQLGITMASLGLGWIGEPAFARLLEPLFHAMGIEAPAVVHGLAFIIAFTVITALHLVIGEQAPKIFAIREPEKMVLWCAVPMKFFYILLYPFLVTLNYATSLLLRLARSAGADEHETPHTENELRELVHHAHVHGELTRSEHRLIHGVFEFDDLICRRVMVPRSEVVYFDVNRPVSECIELARGTKHTRYPLCDGSLDDDILGVVHIKDLVGMGDPDSVDLRSVMRPPRYVPETMSVSRLLRHFQTTHQLMALVVDEHGSVVGIVTLENVLEPIVGSVEDEFDTEPTEIVSEGPGQFLVLGSAPLSMVTRQLKLHLEMDDVDTFSGAIVQFLGRIPEVGDRVELPTAVAEILEVKGRRATRIRVQLKDPDAGEP